MNTNLKSAVSSHVERDHTPKKEDTLSEGQVYACVSGNGNHNYVVLMRINNEKLVAFSVSKCSMQRGGYRLSTNRFESKQYEHGAIRPFGWLLIGSVDFSGILLG